ncbi:ectoine/hydroxyectoine ABC transporter permease subunit EhuC [Streptomyces albus]|uniref:ectoine/hydroxyectoine ABC transporter permease subunit EhuC n=1 Tax=Streptomyces TaxID=1883 RepID=UPI000527DBBE|nr:MULTISPECIES: ectoine/hydroxyectoine ABC transporter permease subunit EhuC [Streptomyces]KPC73624.1 amino acid ABC transporter permease [Streptomyces sp. NRRL F-6602]QID36492.1 ectoine/hydroxyectoine ABC transporter permease subunit EhuC [Streptomyces albus]
MMTSGMFTNWFLPGIWVTIQVTVLSAALGAFIAFTIGYLRTSRLWIVRFLSGAYVEIFRGTSALVLMFWMFFALPLLGWQLLPMWAGVSALGLTYGAYGSEIVRGALAAVAPAQREAGIALSFTPMQRFRRIELPQAWPEMIPPFNNLLIELLKGTALVSVITVADMTFAGNLVRLGENKSAPIYSLLLVLYFIMAFAITRGMRVVERHARAGVGQAPPKKGLFSSRKAPVDNLTPADAASTGGTE